MKNLMALAVASWLVVAAATAQTTNPPTPPKSDASQQGMMPGMDMSEHSPAQSTKHMPDMPGMRMDDVPARPQQPSISGTQTGRPPMDMGRQAGGDLQGGPNDANQQRREQEDPEGGIAASLPAPELLNDVVTRTPIKLSEFLKLSDENNPTLKQAAAVVRRSAAQAKQAGLYPNPSVGYQGEQIRGGSLGGGEQGAYIAQPIILGGKLGLRREIYEQQERSDEAAAEAQIDRVHGDVTQAFYRTLSAQETVVVRDRLLKLTLDAVETAHQLANVGQADAPDILQAEVEAEQAKIDYADAQREFLEEFKMLSALTGKTDLPASPLDAVFDAPPDIDTDQIVNMIVQSSPTVKQARQEVSVAEAKLKDARRESIPDLQLKGGEQYNFEALPESPGRATGPQSFASAGVNLPLWNHNQGNKEAAEADIERAQQELQRVQLSLRRQAEPLVQTYLSSKFEADRYRTQLIPRATRAYQLYLKKYEEMAMAYPQVLVSQRTLFQLQVSYIHALGSVWQSAIALQNDTLTGGLEMPLSTSSPSTTINLPGSSAGGGAE